MNEKQFFNSCNFLGIWCGASDERLPIRSALRSVPFWMKKWTEGSSTKTAFERSRNGGNRILTSWVVFLYIYIYTQYNILFDTNNDDRSGTAFGYITTPLPQNIVWYLAIDYRWPRTRVLSLFCVLQNQVSRVHGRWARRRFSFDSSSMWPTRNLCAARRRKWAKDRRRKKNKTTDRRQNAGRRKTRAIRGLIYTFDPDAYGHSV